MGHPLVTKEPKLADPDPSTYEKVFTELAATLTLFGALGGMARALALRSHWRETVRAVLVGAITAFGFGEVAPVMARWAIPELPSGFLGVLTASAFLVGITAIAFVEFIISKVGRSDEKQ